MSKNSLINIKPEVKKNIIKNENFSNTKINNYLLGTKGINETIFDSIKKKFELSNNLSLKDREIISKVLKSYKKIVNNKSLNEDEFVLTKHEINEFLNLESKNILRYVLYRYKYNLYPRLKILEEYPPNIQVGRPRFLLHTQEYIYEVPQRPLQ